MSCVFCKRSGVEITRRSAVDALRTTRNSKSTSKRALCTRYTLATLSPLQYWLALWKRAHPVYRDRAEERRRTVGSDAYSTAHKPAIHTQAVVLESTAPPPRMPVSTNYRPMEMTNDAVIPGHSRMQEKKSEAPSIGQMLLAKDGWLQKHKEEQVSVVGQTSSNHGGLGYQSMILEGDNFLKKWRVCSQTGSHRTVIHTNTWTQ